MPCGKWNLRLGSVRGRCGTLHCKFDNGRMLGVIPDVDKFHIIEQEQTEEIMETENAEEFEELNMSM